ncbi:MAG: ABC transporter permease [Proteobacteria bacterium]|nr:FtsX-like permease family protein [Desulfobacula sp.]MBU3952092.1 ABC transporter permease [Pseudomonadota bacterium]MBU4131880.1 ABC transporter permease [Pseudomonadota bacterium]
MKLENTLHFSIQALFGYPARTLLVLLAMAMGVASVMVLTSLGEGARLYINREFTSLGTNILIVLPGRSETTGGPPPLLGQTPRDLTLEDALSLKKSPFVAKVAPIVIGSAPVSWRQKDREVTILGTTADMFDIRQLTMGQGAFLPPGDPSSGSGIAVIGYKIKKELFGNQSALGEWIRIQDWRFRVIGVLAKKGQSLGMDMSDLVIIPVASAQSLFNTEALFRIMIQAKNRNAISTAKDAILRIIQDRHDGEDDITVITQDAILSTFDRIFTALTFTIAGIAAVSLGVAGILIMNVMLISVSQRKSEIGLLKALGAGYSQILQVFLAEAAILSMTGALLGLVLAFLGTYIIARLFPYFPVHIPPWSVAASVLTAQVTGLIFGVLPARRAAAMDPVSALSRR